MDMAKENFFFQLEKLHLKNTVVPTTSKAIFTVSFQDLMSMTNYVRLEGKTRMISFPVHLTKKCTCLKKYLIMIERRYNATIIKIKKKKQKEKREEAREEEGKREERGNNQKGF